MNITNWFLAIALVIAGLIHLIPGVGVLSADRLAALYGTRLESPDLILLMRHRAVLFALVGALLLAAAFVPHLRPAAIAIGMVSMLGFLVLFALSGDVGPEVRRVFWVDVGAAVLLGLASVTHYWPR